MKRSALLFLPVAVAMLCMAWTIHRGKNTPKKPEISGTILINHDYCGGVRPANSTVFQPYAVAGTTLYVRREGSPLVIDSVVSDSAGKFSIRLQYGKYNFVEKWKVDPIVMPVNSKYETWDTACFRKEYNRADYFIEVTKPKKDVQILLPRHCAWSRPCCSYSGPKAPAAPPTNRGGFQPGHQE
jgi:hypothetical protein